MTSTILRTGGWVLVWAVIAVSAPGCEGCTESTLEQFEEWSQSHPERSGKVGTLQALKVAQTARQTVDDRVRLGDGPCDVGWRLDEPFVVEFDLEIDVDGSRRTRGWTEKGTWKRDDAGRWLIDNDVEYRDGEVLEGTRQQQVFADEDGVWEWLGPDVVARHEAEGPVRRHWKRSFGGRFGELMALVSDEWTEAETDEGATMWIPGGERERCGPVLRLEEVADWRPLLEARGSSIEARITDESEEGEDAKRCRRFEAVYGLRGGDRMEIDYRECTTGDAPRRVKRPEAGRVVEATRDRQRARLRSQMSDWIEKGLVEPGDESEPD